MVIYREKVQTSRIKFIQEHFDEMFKNSNTLVEMGAHWGDFSKMIHNRYQNLQITCEEGREGVQKEGERRYSQFSWNKINYELTESTKTADIIICFGLLYHISPKIAESFIKSSINRAEKLFLLETEVMDCDNENCWLSHDGAPCKEDKAMVDIEIRPSIKWVEDIFEELGFKWKRFDLAELNVDNYLYDWVSKNTKTQNHDLRKLWAVWKEPKESQQPE